MSRFWDAGALQAAVTLPHAGSIELMSDGLAFRSTPTSAGDWQVMRLDLELPHGSYVRVRLRLRPPEGPSQLYLGQMGGNHVGFVDLATCAASTGAGRLEARRVGDQVEVESHFRLEVPILFIGVADAWRNPIHSGQGEIAFTLVEVQIELADAPLLRSDSIVVSSDFLAVRPQVELTTLQVPVGTCSIDKVVAFGRDGYLFVYEGSNGIADQYLTPAEDVEALAGQWASRIRGRRRYCLDRGMDFAQIIIPEKSSLLPELAPFPAADGTPLFKRLGAMLAGDNYFLDMRAAFDQQTRFTAYPKTNGHLSPEGTLTVFNRTLESLGLPGATAEFGPPVVTRCDLSDHFGGLQLYNLTAPLLATSLAHESAGVDLIYKYEPATHSGRRYIWRNEKAPVAKRVLAFGNSFFECGNVPQQLSWWFSRWFQDFQFVWTNNLEPHIVEEFRPDIIVCQTIERFLLAAPRE